MTVVSVAYHPARWLHRMSERRATVRRATTTVGDDPHRGARIVPSRARTRRVAAGRPGRGRLRAGHIHERPELVDELHLQLADLHDIPGAQHRVRRLDAVDQNAVAAAEVANHRLFRIRELGVTARQQRVRRVADVARRIASDDHRADQHELARLAVAADNEAAAHRRVTARGLQHRQFSQHFVVPGLQLRQRRRGARRIHHHDHAAVIAGARELRERRRQLARMS